MCGILGAIAIQLDRNFKHIGKWKNGGKENE